MTVKERMATYRGEIGKAGQSGGMEDPTPPVLSKAAEARARKILGIAARPRVLRRFVERGGELVEIEQVIRETR